MKGEAQKTTVTIGVYGEITATVARDRAQKIIQKMVAGINPNEVGKAKKREVEEKKRAKLLEKQAKEITVGRVLTDYLDT